MTRFPHDQFAKDYLKELLSPLGEVETSRDVPGEVRELDIFFTPISVNIDYAQSLGLLGRLATNSAVFEPFRNAVTPSQIRSCMGKLFDVHVQLERQAKREDKRLREAQLPLLWILTPTASSALLDGFGFLSITDENWTSGVYRLGPYLKTGLVAIHQLPRIPETLWLRILGKGGVQKQAIEELAALPENHPLRANALELLYNLQANLAANQDLEAEDRELIMALAPLYRQQIEAAVQQGREQGIQQGIQQGQRLIIENFLRVRFGQLDEALAALVEPLSALPPEQLTLLLLQLSQGSDDSQGTQQGQSLIIESLLKFHFGEWDEQLAAIAQSVLALPHPELTVFLQQLSKLDRQELLAKFPH